MILHKLQDALFCEKCLVIWLSAFSSQIDILVNNAGRGQRGLASTTSIEVDQAMLDVNVMGPISLTKAVLPHMMKRKQGHICVTSSVNGVIG